MINPFAWIRDALGIRKGSIEAKKAKQERQGLVQKAKLEDGQEWTDLDLYNPPGREPWAMSDLPSTLLAWAGWAGESPPPPLIGRPLRGFGGGLRRWAVGV